MSEIDTLKLIYAVKPRPALHNKNDERYYCPKKKKQRIWYQVCQEVFEDWNQLSQPRKVEHVRELKKRWKSLRTCFTRELDFQRKEKIKAEEGEPVKKRKIYEHFDQLQFLRGENDDNDARDSGDSTDQLSYSRHPDEMDDGYGESSNDVKNIPDTNSESPLANFQTSTANEGNNQKEGDEDVLKHLKREEHDADRYFMLSLVPCFKKMNDEQKMEARIEILKVLQNIAFQDE